MIGYRRPTSTHEIQNKLIKKMTLQVLRKLANSPFASIMINETTDVTNKELVTIVICAINDDFDFVVSE